MGAAKRRGTFEQRKAQRLAKQYGLTNQDFAEAYAMNIIYDFNLLRESKSYRQLQQSLRIINYYHR